MGDLVDVSAKELITAQRQNDINDYIEDGTHKVNTLSLDIGGTEVITAARSISGIVNITASGNLTVENSIFNLTTGKLIDINTTRSGAEDTRVIDMGIADTSTSADFGYFRGETTSTAGSRYFFEVQMTSDGGDVTTLYSYIEAKGAGNSCYGSDSFARVYGGGSAYGWLATVADKAGETASTLYGGSLHVSKNIAGSTAVGLELASIGTQTVDTGLKFTGDFTDGIDMGANSISNVTNITASTITLGSTTLTEQNLIDLLALI